jgi:cysteine desulfurase
MTKALELVSSELATQVEKLQELQGEFWTLLQAAFPRARLNGPAIGAKRACNNLNVTFVGSHIPMSLQGIAVSRGSACHSGKWTPSPVLRALGFSETDAQSTLRISMGLPTTIADIHQAITVLKKQITSN